MSALRKKFVFITIAVITIAALLLPAPKLGGDLVSTNETQPKTMQMAAKPDLRGPSPDKSLESSAYTWAG